MAAFSQRPPDRSGAVRESTRRQHESAVRRVIEAFHANLDQPLELAGMARIAFASPFHFDRIFRRVAGIPPRRYLYALRLQAAARLLLATDRNVLDICYEVGYNSLGTFTRRFTELVGVPPLRFRTLARSMSPDEFLRELERCRETNAGERACGTTVSGALSVTVDFDGVALIGLFPDAIPQGRPVAGAVAIPGGPYAIYGAPDGEFHLFAAGLPLDGDPQLRFDNRDLPRGGGQSIRIGNGEVLGETSVELHAPAITDPPILVALPVLLAEFGRALVRRAGA